MHVWGEDVAPTELLIYSGVSDYKDSAPTELQGQSPIENIVHFILRLFLFISLAASLSLAVCFCGCSKRSRNLSLPTTRQANDLQVSPPTQSTPKRININTASAQELESLPGIGKALAERIVEHRNKYGPFRKPEHLIIMRGISDRRFQNLRDLITVE